MFDGFKEYQCAVSFLIYMLCPGYPRELAAGGQHPAGGGGGGAAALDVSGDRVGGRRPGGHHPRHHAGTRWRAARVQGQATGDCLHWPQHQGECHPETARLLHSH